MKPNIAVLWCRSALWPCVLHVGYIRHESVIDDASSSRGEKTHVNENEKEGEFATFFKFMSAQREIFCHDMVLVFISFALWRIISFDDNMNSIKEDRLYDVHQCMHKI